MINLIRYGDREYNGQIADAAAKLISENDFVVDPMATNFRTFHGCRVKHIFAGELSPAVHQAQFTLLNSDVADTMIDKAVSRFSRIEDKAQYQYIYNDYIRNIRDMGYNEQQDVNNAVAFCRLTEAHRGNLLWDKSGDLIAQKDIFPETSAIDLFHANVGISRHRVQNLMMFSYAPTPPHITVRNAVNAYKEIKNHVDRFVLFTVIPPQQAKKADIVSLTENPWTDADRGYFMEEISSVVQELGDSAKIYLVMPDTVTTYDTIKLWPLKVKKTHSLPGFVKFAYPDTVFELVKE